MRTRVLTVAPDDFGFKQYASDLYATMSTTGFADPDFEILPPLYSDPITSQDSIHRLIERIEASKPDLVHFHHEFGWLGGRSPLRYQFPSIRKAFARSLPGVRLVATAHAVIPSDFKYVLRGRGWKMPSRMVANLFFLPLLKKYWIRETWGELDGTIVHSRHLLPTIERSGCSVCKVIPHYVPTRYDREDDSEKTLNLPRDRPIISIFGYFRPEKAQDLAIEALAKTKTRPLLVLGGGVGRPEDQPYLDSCRERIRKLNLESDVLITGFLSWRQLDQLCQQTRLALLPFRETTGSGSLADLLSRRTAILASSIPLNEEINERQPGTLALFRRNDPDSLAQMIDSLIHDPAKLNLLRENAARYSDQNSPPTIGQIHLEFFRKVIAEPH